MNVFAMRADHLSCMRYRLQVLVEVVGAGARGLVKNREDWCMGQAGRAQLFGW